MNLSDETNKLIVMLSLSDRYLGPSPTILAHITSLRKYGFRFEPTGAGTYVCDNLNMRKEMSEEDLAQLMCDLSEEFTNVDFTAGHNYFGPITLITISPEKEWGL